MAVFKCKMCGGTIEFEQGATVGVCDSCGTKQTLPRVDDDRLANLYGRANHFRRNNEFDKAAGIYEQILNENTTDAEAYWSLVLCRYGIEYVEDPATRKRIPTVNRAQFTSIFDDDNYKSALQYADSAQKVLYESEANAINEIQKGILAISQKEEPFDVFICYKETDAAGKRTQDSVLANDLYHQLTQEGFKVFFARITLEDKLGTAYEPYIFAALNSAKVMVVLGTKPEYFNAVWVKNEWSRYLNLVKVSGGKKVLIPAYRDMDPYDLPDEFSHLQAQDMSKLGFMQDLIRGIKKITSAETSKAVVKETVVSNAANASIAPLLKRAFMFLEDGEWSKADDFCEQVLNQDPENARAYLGKLMADLHVHRQEDLPNCEQPFDGNNNYQKAVRFGDEKVSSALNGYIAHINERNENARLTGIYNDAVGAMNGAKSEAEFKFAAEKFKTLHGFKDSDTLVEKCFDKAEECRKDFVYATGKSQMSRDRVAAYEAAISTFQTISGWRDADGLIAVCQREIELIREKDEADRLERERKEEVAIIERKRIEDEKRLDLARRQQKRKKALKVLAPVALVILALVLLTVFLIIPYAKLNKAVSLMERGYYDDATLTLKELNGFASSENKLTVIKAVKLIKKGSFDEAIKTIISARATAKVKYNVNGGQNSDETECVFSSESDYSGLLVPTREGYRFSGWSLSDFNYTKDNSVNLFLDATWSDGYTISYQLNGGTADNPTEYHKEGQDITIKPPLRNGYTFLGWTGTDLEQPTKQLSIQSGSFGDKEYAANWKPNQYTFTLDANGGRVDLTTVSADYESSYSLPTPVRDYYTFSGWYDGIKLYEGGTWNEARDTTLVAKWSPVSYSVSYNLAGGTNQISNPSSLTVESGLIELKDPERPGYRFCGWYSDNSFSNRKTTIPAGMHENVILYAKWEVIHYSVSYDLNGGSISGTKITSFTIDDLPITLPSAKKDGFVFLNWGNGSYDGSVVAIIKSPGDLLLVASYMDPNLRLTLSGDHYVVAGYAGKPSEVVIPAYYNGKPVTEIKEEAFMDNMIPSRLISVSIPKTIVKIGNSAFDGCTSLKNINIPDGIKAIEDYTFCECRSLERITIPESVTSIGDYAFKSCYNLSAINLPSGLTKIGEYAFAFCSALKEIILPEGITVLDKTFYKCENLTNVVLPSSLQEMKNDVFLGCARLTAIVIPKSVTKMGYMVFYGCRNITIYCRAESIPDGWNSNWNEGRDADYYTGEKADVHTVVWGFTG